MKHLSCGFFAAAIAVGSWLLASPVATFAQGMPPADFGSPPSGEIPIIFNDHHVYTKPDVDKQDRVLAALVRGNSILVPLRSMFEQMGATVSYDPASKTVDVSKPGADIKVTVGRPEVVINGETRPLDVAPMMYHGAVLVPIRVISEGMGAYVQWLPSKHTVVVRYVPAPSPTAPPAPPAPPPPTAAPTAPPPPPTPAPTPTVAPTRAPVYEHFIVGDYLLRPKVYNEFSPGNSGKSSYSARGAAEFPILNLPIMVGADWRHWSYPAGGGPVGTIGGAGSTLVPAFTASENDIDARAGIRVASPRIYVNASYISQNNNYGYPQMRGWGAGIEKLPDLDTTLTVYASAYYYPSVWGTYGATPLQYHLIKYEIGVDWNIMGPNFPLFLDAGFLGNYYTNKVNAPVNVNKYGPYVGLGIHI